MYLRKDKEVQCLCFVVYGGISSEDFSLLSEVFVFVSVCRKKAVVNFILFVFELYGTGVFFGDSKLKTECTFLTIFPGFTLFKLQLKKSYSESLVFSCSCLG